MTTEEISSRSRVVAILLCLLLGFFGVHRFYVGKIGTGILMILTAGGLGIWYVADLILVIFGVFRDKDGKRVFRWFEAGSI